MSKRNPPQLDMFPAAKKPRAKRRPRQSDEVGPKPQWVEVLECLQKCGPLGKDGIAARTSLSGVQVCRRLDELAKRKLATPTGRFVQSTMGLQEREWKATPHAAH
jgi:hypothetical protein